MTRITSNKIHYFKSYCITFSTVIKYWIDTSIIIQQKYVSAQGQKNKSDVINLIWYYPRINEDRNMSLRIRQELKTVNLHV